MAHRPGAMLSSCAQSQDPSLPRRRPWRDVVILREVAGSTPATTAAWTRAMQVSAEGDCAMAHRPGAMLSSCAQSQDPPPATAAALARCVILRDVAGSTSATTAALARCCHPARSRRIHPRHGGGPGLGRCWLGPTWIARWRITLARCCHPARSRRIHRRRDGRPDLGRRRLARPHFGGEPRKTPPTEVGGAQGRTTCLTVSSAAAPGVGGRLPSLDAARSGALGAVHRPICGGVECDASSW
jgi:hypothetical protein